MTTRKLLLAAALAIAAWFMFFGEKSAPTDVAEPVKRALVPSASVAADRTTEPSPATIVSAPVAGRTTAANSAAAKGATEPVILALLPRANLIGGARTASQTEKLFTSQSWTPPPPPPPKPLPPPPPTAPAVPFTYLGKKIEDKVWEVYLARGEQTIIVREKSVIDGTYSIDSIKPPMLILTYLPLKQVQMITIGGTD